MKESQGSWGVKAVIPDLRNFDGDIKATKRQWYAPCCWVCLLQLIKKKKKHSIYQPSHSWTVSGACANPQTHPTSSIMGNSLLHIADSQDHVGEKNRWL